MTADPARPLPDGSPTTPRAAGAPRHEATCLTAGGNRAEIVLGEQVYTLRITKAGKLILTK